MNNLGGPVAGNPSSRDELLLQRRALEKELKRRAARENLQDFIEYCMPDPEDFDNVLKSKYEAKEHHKLMMRLFTDVSLMLRLRLGLSIPPQHGKSTVFGQYGIAWHAARNPEHKIIYGTFSEPRAGIVGASVLNLMQSDRFREVFPEFEIRPGEASKFLIGFGREGSVMFVGRGTGASGNPCDLFIIDDPYKSRSEARSGQVRGIVWDWYNSVVEARCPAMTPIVIIHTRWNDDDLIGRLCDPDHPEHDPDDADNYDYVNIPAIIETDEQSRLLNLPVGSALWAESKGKPKFPIELLRRRQRLNPMNFSAIYMGRPVPPEGDFYTNSMIVEYQRNDMPREVRKYGASDHAVSESVRADKTVMGIGCLDSNGVLWIHPDLIWAKIPADRQVVEQCRLIESHSPVAWFAEGDHIKKSLGPFLKARMKAMRLFKTSLRELPKNADKVAKSQSIQGMMSLGMVRFPAFAPWWPDAKAQMMRFDGSEGKADDFCDFIANLGRGLDQMMVARAGKPKEEKNLIATGTAAWVKMAARADRLQKDRKNSFKGW